MKKKLAVLIATYNRVEKTIFCIEELYKAIPCDNIILKIFLTDSNSPDNTIKIIKEKFLEIDCFNAGDNVYWNQGMICSWERAKKINPDYYLWLNDDTYLFKNSLKILFLDLNKLGSNSILVGVTEFKGEITYGGRKSFINENLLEPKGYPQKVKYMEGNCVLISRQVYESLGVLNKYYQHSLGDVDYGLRAIRNGINVYISSETIGNCVNNDFLWYDNSFNFKKRLDFLLSPKGLPLKDYSYFIINYFGFIRLLKFLTSTIFALIFPTFYIKLKKIK